MYQIILVLKFNREKEMNLGLQFEKNNQHFCTLL